MATVSELSRAFSSMSLKILSHGHCPLLLIFILDKNKWVGIYSWVCTSRSRARGRACKEVIVFWVTFSAVKSEARYSGHTRDSTAEAHNHRLPQPKHLQNIQMSVLVVTKGPAAIFAAGDKIVAATESEGHVSPFCRSPAPASDLTVNFHIAIHHKEEKGNRFQP